jgi:hypothetical protein
MCNLHLLRAWLRRELAEQKRKQHESCRLTLWAFEKSAWMKVRLEPVRKESLPCTSESILTRVVRAHLTARREQHGPESDPCAKLHGAATVWKCVKPEHRAINLPLPCCAGEWSAIEWRSVEIPSFKRVRLFRWRE